MPRRGSARTTIRRPSSTASAGPFDQWPSGMGFDYFYGFMGGETDQWTPYLFQDHTQIFPWIGKPGYNLTTDMADEAINYMKQLNAAAPDKPFFVYYVPGGSHSPHQPTKEWSDKFKGKFDMGWNAMREQIFANQKRLGVIPANAQLTPWPDSLREMGHAVGRREEALRPASRGVRGLHGLYRPRDRPRHPAGRGHGQARQHADHLHRRRQRHQPRRHAARHAQPVHLVQRHPELPGRRAAQVLRRLGLGGHLPAHGGRVVVGIRHAVQVDQADRVALRRHPAGPGDLVAGPHQGRRRHPPPVPPHHRHRAHHPRSHGYQVRRRWSTASSKSRSKA